MLPNGSLITYCGLVWMDGQHLPIAKLPLVKALLSVIDDRGKPIYVEYVLCRRPAHNPEFRDGSHSEESNEI